jgi:thiol-disulfide isomerase/thioredoxin
MVIARVVAAAVLTLAALECVAEIKPWTGKSTPALKRQELSSGHLVKLGDFRGRVVLVNFWATWCIPCRDEMPSIMRLREKLSGKPFDVLTVNYGEGAAGIERFLAKEGITLPVLLDPEKKAAETWRVRGLPMTFLVDAQGRVRYSTFGELDWSEGEPYDLVAKLVEEVGRARQ